jgi:CubicO group peptidase (beta-lactamase class C family)
MRSVSVLTKVLAGWLGLLTALSAAAAGLPRSTPEKEGLSSERLARMDRTICGYVEAGRTPGVLVVIARHGKIVHEHACGAADFSSNRPLRPDALFRLYSMTKPITSVALLMLYEEGRFQLTDPLAKYFPAFANVKVYAGMTPTGAPLLDDPRRPITIQDVFSHSAGFTYGLFGNTPVDQAVTRADVFATDLDGLMTKLATLPLLYQPGERWVYSVSHDVQAALVEKLSGMKFDQFVRTRIFAPLGMKESMFKVPDTLRASVPTLYAPAPDGKLVLDTSPLGKRYGDQVFGGYSISSTAGDYAVFGQMLLNKGQYNGVRLLSSKTVELMTQNHLGPAALASASTPPVSLGRGAGYGLGVSVLMDPAQHGNLGSVGEFGWSGAASTHFLVDPQEELVALYMTQLMMGDFALRAEWVTLLYQSIVGP